MTLAPVQHHKREMGQWYNPYIGGVIFFSNFFFFVCGCAGSVAARAFYSCGNRGLLSSCGARTSRCSDFSCCGARAPRPQASVVVAHGLSCPVACGILPDQGLKTGFPSLAGRFLTTGPPGEEIPKE